MILDEINSTLDELENEESVRFNTDNRTFYMIKDNKGYLIRMQSFHDDADRTTAISKDGKNWAFGRGKQTLAKKSFSSDLEKSKIDVAKMILKLDKDVKAKPSFN